MLSVQHTGSGRVEEIKSSLTDSIAKSNVVISQIATFFSPVIYGCCVFVKSNKFIDKEKNKSQRK